MAQYVLSYIFMTLPSYTANFFLVGSQSLMTRQPTHHYCTATSAASHAWLTGAVGGS